MHVAHYLCRYSRAGRTLGTGYSVTRPPTATIVGCEPCVNTTVRGRQPFAFGRRETCTRTCFIIFFAAWMDGHNHSMGKYRAEDMQFPT